MDTRQHLVETWKAKLEENSRPPTDGGERFIWVRQMYTRIYRFLVSCYGEGRWQAADDDSSRNGDLQTAASHMPFVECVPPSNGLLPKSPERIQAALKSIHDSNPGIAIAGTMRGVEHDAWIVVAARKKPELANAVRQTLVANGIEARLLGRTTDTAIIVRHGDFSSALAVAQTVVRARKYPMARRVIIKGVAPVSAVGVVLLIASVLTLLAVVFLNDTWYGTMPLALCTLWIAGLVAGWLFVHRRADR